MQKSQYSISFMDWKKLLSPIRVTLANPNFQYFCELGKVRSIFSLRPTFKNPNFESKDELENAISEFEFHCWRWKEFM